MTTDVVCLLLWAPLRDWPSLIEIETDIDSVLAWGETHGVHPLVLELLRANPTYLMQLTCTEKADACTRSAACGTIGPHGRMGEAHRQALLIGALQRVYACVQNPDWHQRLAQWRADLASGSHPGRAPPRSRERGRVTMRSVPVISRPTATHRGSSTTRSVWALQGDCMLGQGISGVHGTSVDHSGGGRDIHPQRIQV